MSLSSDDKVLRQRVSINNLHGDCLNLIFKRLETKKDSDSFGLTCRQWLRIQNDNYESLWNARHDLHYLLPKFSRESLPSVLSKLLIRFQNIKSLSLMWLPEITDYFSLESQFSESKIQKLSLDQCHRYSDAELSSMFSLFPRLTFISLKFSQIADKGLEVLAKSCSSLETINLSRCCSVTDSGISFLLQNCLQLRSLYIYSCSSISGVGFLGCPKTLSHVSVGGCKLKPEGIEAIVSGGGIEVLGLSTPYNKQTGINTEAVVKISKSCPLLKELDLEDCEVEFEGWEAIAQNCTNLELLNVCGCRKLCDLGLQTLSNGCNKLSRLYVDVDHVNNWSRSAIDLFRSRKPNVMQLRLLF
ncbi:hypothetical protein MKW92_009214 [Papaver armeniacum]|nr:hypothetical protein MKW92_009214 [Papaver armeniacum]